MDRRIVSGCLAALVWCLGQSAEARPNDGIVCEQWRDYIYNASTGVFIEWIGEPYWVCYSKWEPVSHPRSPFPDRYEGGVGHPTKTKCSTCKHQANVCHDKIRSGVTRCVAGQERYFRWWCINHRTQRFGKAMGNDYTCEIIRENDPEFGKPVTKMVCGGPSIEECIASYRRDYPETTSTDSLSLQLGPDFFQIGVESTISVSWGGVYGFASACRDAGSQGTNICASTQSACEARAGGCNP